MENKLIELFKKKDSDILSIYFTAGHPELNKTGDIITSLQASGVDFIEVGMPFSDPMADGPTIQESSSVALKNGMNLDVYFSQLKEIKDKVEIPLLAMGYVNQMMRFGVEKFLEMCVDAGISGLILPDLPLKVYEEEFKEKFEKHGLINIFLITPQTSEERIRKIDAISSAFIYMVSSSSTTGSKTKSESAQTEYFERIEKMNLNTPKVIGFGISNKDKFNQACKYSSGAIVGSAFVKHLNENPINTIGEFIKSIK